MPKDVSRWLGSALDCGCPSDTDVRQDDSGVLVCAGCGEGRPTGGQRVCAGCGEEVF